MLRELSILCIAFFVLCSVYDVRAALVAFAPADRPTWLASSPDAIVVDGDNRSIGTVECKVPANGAPKPPTDSHIVQCWMHAYATGLPWTDYVSLGATHVLVARVVFEPDVFNEAVLPLLQDFYDARAEETIGLLSPREAADLRQELRDYRAVHLNTAPRIVEHKLKFD